MGIARGEHDDLREVEELRARTEPVEGTKR